MMSEAESKAEQSFRGFLREDENVLNIEDKNQLGADIDLNNSQHSQESRYDLEKLEEVTQSKENMSDQSFASLGENIS